IAALLPAARASAVRKELRELGVPVVSIHPIPHQMKYDRSEIYVEAGKPVEFIFENTDIMPHNLVIVKPGALQKVGLEAEKLTADPNAVANHFVPKVSEVLAHTKLLQPRDRETLLFTVPGQVGDYPFVCTYPGHWRTMNGVLHVVQSLDDVPPEVLAASQSAPAPTGPSRPFVRKWEFADLEGELGQLDGDRNPMEGQKLFTELSCVKCHKLHGQGGNVGPELVDVRKKLSEGKMNRPDVLVELITPSKKIDDKFRTVTLQKFDGTLVNGIILEETSTEVRLAANPLDEKASKEPIVVPVTEIEERFPSQVSLMPEGLLNTCSKEEILDLLHYVLTSPPGGHQH
ncbi:MAG: c-type cytochrome, partial [Planctomycetaceae bacterium]|nr:c-type cytochrome [Planctomycetaceae bacterium]